MSEPRRDTIRVLLVEDNPGDARLIREALRDVSASPFELTHVDRLSAAFERLDEGGHDVLLLDLSLPDSKGLETVARAREHAPRIPIVVLTGLNDEMTAFLALRKGAQDYLVKDMVNGRLLLRVIRYGIERKRVEDVLQASEDAARRLAEENATLAQIGRIISASLDISEVYESFAQEVKKLVAFDRISINMCDLEKGTNYSIFSYGVAMTDDRERDIPLKGSLAEEVMRSRSSVVLQVTTREEVAGRFPRLLQNFDAGLRSFLAVPLALGDQVIGALHLQSRMPHAYSERDVALAERVATQITGAIANAHLHAQVEREARERAALAEIGRIISSSLNLEDVYPRFVEEVRKLIPFDRTTINLVDLENGTFTDAYVMGVDVPARRQGQVTPLEGTHTGEVVRRREGVLHQTESMEEIGARFPGLKPNIEAGLRSFLSVPLISNDRVIGVLHLNSLKPNAYSQSHVVLAESVASQIAGAIANAQLHAERLRAEDALRESERRYRHMIESASEVVFTADARGCFTYVNPPASVLTEYPEDRLIGRYFTELVAPEWRGRVKRFYLKQFAKRIPETSLEFPMVTMSGKVKWVEQSVTLQIEDGDVVGFQAIGRDISKRREIQEERERLIIELQQALNNVKTLSGLLPICASCKKIRDDKGYWNQIETYIREHSGVDFSHGICPECVKTLYPGLYSQYKTQEEVKK